MTEPAFQVIDPALLASFSRGEVTRRQIENRMGLEVGFGDLLHGLHLAGLPLPLIPANPASEGARLVRDLALRASRAA